MTSKYDIAAKVELANLDGFVGKLSAKQQRDIFGRAIFGKKVIAISARNQGSVNGSFQVCFGTDSASFDFSFEEIAELANNPERPVRF